MVPHSRRVHNQPCVVAHITHRPQLKALLRPCLTIAACPNRDRIDTNSVVEISSVRVRKVLTDHAGTITESIIPEKYRVYEGNKVGTIKAPSAICTGPSSMLFIADVLSTDALSS